MWFDRVGLTLQFLAAFSIAPEILGPSGLHRLRGAIGLGFQLALYIPAGIAVSLVAWAVAFRELAAHLHRIAFAALVSVAILGMFLSGLRLVRKHVLSRLIEDLEDDEALRRRLLEFGGITFFLGFLCQLVATSR